MAPENQNPVPYLQDKRVHVHQDTFTNTGRPMNRMEEMFWMAWFSGFLCGVAVGSAVAVLLLWAL